MTQRNTVRDDDLPIDNGMRPVDRVDVHRRRWWLHPEVWLLELANIAVLFGVWVVHDDFAISLWVTVPVGFVLILLIDARVRHLARIAR
ncbi:hypothetical protein [Williamsia maris]|uniref:Uncharacterized protein n=1 Tax=Williamsia maris TaxID=72806 RepID=A0ABT1H885_9NOCA|nr:hypothetical protein [Williamsia maris]MCP2174471.1 hypothetical protein [Williamsia maris]